MNSRNKIYLGAIALMTVIAVLPSFKTSNQNPLDHKHEKVCGMKGCTFLTLFGEESSEGHSAFKNPALVKKSLNRGLDFLMEAQHRNGGWGAGSHSRQQIRDPHAVNTDPATTAMVGMALIRNGTTLKSGEYNNQLKGALEYLLKAVETTPKNRLKITDQSGTQIQTKLGDNIDVVMAAQFFNAILETKGLNANQKSRIKSALSECVARIQSTQAQDGSTSGDGWAGVLQSSFANQALELAEVNDIEIDREALDKARDFQKSNYDPKSGNIAADRGAGVMLYSVSGSVRASAKEARRAKKLLDSVLTSSELAEIVVTGETLEEIGLSKDEAAKLATSYNVYNSAKERAQENGIMSGFGNNGGEEFLSFLQTGESIVVAGDNDWKKWYDDMAGRILSIQNNDGSWSGHHCITSPVFCTATCLLILSIDQDIEKLQRIGDS